MAGSVGNDGPRPGSGLRVAVWGTAAALMLLPVLAIGITEGVAWDAGDFTFLVILWIGVGAAYELAARVSDRSAYTAAVGIALAAAFLLTWINLAVGIIGNEDNPANLMYGGVLAIGIVGAIAARFRPHGMAPAMVATALAQALVFLIALLVGFGFTGPITVFFAALWLISAWLFRKAANSRRRSTVGSPKASASNPFRGDHRRTPRS